MALNFLFFVFLKRLISFEDKSVQKELRSVWMIMLSGVKFGRAFIEWGQSFRLYHVTSGMYLGVESNEVILIDGTQADQARTSFSFVRKSVSYTCRTLSQTHTHTCTTADSINFSLVFF